MLNGHLSFLLFPISHFGELKSIEHAGALGREMNI